MNMFAKLPKEIKHYIFSLLDDVDVFMLYNVDQYLRNAINRHILIRFPVLQKIHIDHDMIISEDDYYSQLSRIFQICLKCNVRRPIFEILNSALRLRPIKSANLVDRCSVIKDMSLLLSMSAIYNKSFYQMLVRYTKYVKTQLSEDEIICYDQKTFTHRIAKSDDFGHRFQLSDGDSSIVRLKFILINLFLYAIDTKNKRILSICVDILEDRPNIRERIDSDYNVELIIKLFDTRDIEFILRVSQDEYLNNWLTLRTSITERLRRYITNLNVESLRSIYYSYYYSKLFATTSWFNIGSFRFGD